eukprot:SAG31_NODE_16557_length_704_cov_1.092562_1_plen_212_part_10
MNLNLRLGCSCRDRGREEPGRTPVSPVQCGPVEPAMRWFVFIGTKSDGRKKEEGGPQEPSIPVLELNDSTGALSRVHFDAGNLPAPSWLSVNPQCTHLYATCRAEELGAEPTGVGSSDPNDHFAAAFEIDRKLGTLKFLNKQQTVNIGPTHCGAGGEMLVTAQYMGGGVTSFKCAPDGSLLPATSVVEHDYGSFANVRSCVVLFTVSALHPS